MYIYILVYMTHMAQCSCT